MLSTDKVPSPLIKQQQNKEEKPNILLLLTSNMEGSLSNQP